MPDTAMLQFKQQLELAFHPRDFQAMWFVLNNKYSALEFTDTITDEQRIAEYKWIVQQFRKYLSSKKEVILHDCQTADEMLVLTDNWLNVANEYGNDRKTIVYNFVRDDWILELQGYIYSFLYEMNTEEEDE